MHLTIHANGLPGGPGDSGVTFLLHIAPSLRAIIGPAYDLVGFDPRGIGSTCEPDEPPFVRRVEENAMGEERAVRSDEVDDDGGSAVWEGLNEKCALWIYGKGTR